MNEPRPHPRKALAKRKANATNGAAQTMQYTNPGSEIDMNMTSFWSSASSYPNGVGPKAQADKENGSR